MDVYMYVFSQLAAECSTIWMRAYNVYVKVNGLAGFIK